VTDEDTAGKPVSAPPESGKRPHVAIVVVNLPAERDRRVIRECLALEAAGYRVTVVCPRGVPRLTHLPGTRGTAIRTFPQPLAGRGIASFALEFLWSFVCVAWHLAALTARGGLRAVQVCNPPDVFWPLALAMRALGKKWIFDHHDLCPELYECKTDAPRRAVTRTLIFFERMSMRCASAVTTTNESYRAIAIERDGCRPEKVTVVRNGPSLAEIGAPAVPTRPTSATPQIVYLGVMGTQDRVDTAVLAAERLVDARGRVGWQMVLAGDGECMPELRRLVEDRKLADVVRFTGWLEAGQVDVVLRHATIAIQPDPPTDMAHLSTMAKTIEYLARGVPVVAADLRETRSSAGDAAVYVPSGTPDEFAKALDELLDDEPARARMREVALERFRTRLAWDHQAAAYVRVWQSLVPLDGVGPPSMPHQRTGEPATAPPQLANATNPATAPVPAQPGPAAGRRIVPGQR
jgi:glycosyltransferase involved in cell wall biosynthesis